MMHITDISGCVSLHNRVRMPYLGVGTYKVPDGEEVVRTVSCALQAGYRHIDTAAFYANPMPRQNHAAWAQ